MLLLFVNNKNECIIYKFVLLEYNTIVGAECFGKFFIKKIKVLEYIVLILLKVG
jgi:hypothetical protein